MEIVDDIHRLLKYDHYDKSVDVVVIGTCDRDFRHCWNSPVSWKAYRGLGYEKDALAENSKSMPKKFVTLINIIHFQN